MTFRFDFNEIIASSNDSDATGVNDFTPALEKLSLERPKVEGGELFFDHITQFLQSTKVSGLYKRTLADINYQIISQDDDALVQSNDLQSDILLGIYEGGLKTWECSIDLLSYLPDCHNKAVLELGCGSGLPAIKAMASASRVAFQDYNSKVLEYVTLPNILLNSSHPPVEAEDGYYDIELDEDISVKAEFYYGDWSLLSNIIPGKFDVILTSETIYDSESMISLLLLIADKLAEDGVCLVAGKSNYFGCSGSMGLFKSQCIEHQFTFKTIFQTKSGVAREIIELKRV